MPSQEVVILMDASYWMEMISSNTDETTVVWVEELTMKGGGDVLASKAKMLDLIASSTSIRSFTYLHKMVLSHAIMRKSSLLCSK
ncbi:Aminoglycoside phosphotransferase [Penicillium tannophilum]|nr:Aminoglycoside phosphotransferase [Penicillium tannophilum]